MLDFIFEQISARVERVRETAVAARVSPDAEAVHQLRVSIRRCRESIRSLEQWMKPRQVAKLNDRLRPVMKAAGGTRDLDIARGLCLESPIPSAAAVAGSLASLRTKAAHELIEALLAFNLDKLHAPCEPNPAAPPPRILAAGILGELAPRYWQAGDNAARGGSAWEDLHQFRLATKRFRYTLELFAPAYGRGAEAKLALLKRVQTHLGNVNDCETARGLSTVRGDTALVEWLSERQASERAKFVKDWARERERSRAGAGWVRYFSRPR